MIVSRESKLVVDQLLIEMRDRPNDFKCDDCVLLDTKTNIQYWITNLFFDAGIYKPYEMKFGFIQGWRFHSGLNKWKATNMLNLSTLKTLPVDQ